MTPKTFTGSQASCKVFATDLEPTAETQIATFLDCPAFAGCQIRIMPDVHAGAGAVIGFTSPVGPGVCPNVIGVDIGCGVLANRVGIGDVVFAALDAYIRRYVPSGFAIHQHPHTLTAELEPLLEATGEIATRIGADPDKVRRSLGTLGGGNHFIEVGRADSDGALWFAIHSGSRNFGLRVAKWHQDIAKRERPEYGQLAYLTGDAADAYLRDMRIAQKFAEANRTIMAATLAGFDGWPHGASDPHVQVESVHNFIGDDGIIRKCAIQALPGQCVVIPWNMRDGMILGTGFGNADWNYSAPHGAGRVMGRKEAKRSLSVADFKTTMRDAGVWSSCIGADTLDEAPVAYKPRETVEAWLTETVRIEDRIRPVYNFKATGD